MLRPHCVEMMHRPGARIRSPTCRRPRSRHGHSAWRRAWPPAGPCPWRGRPRSRPRRRSRCRGCCGTQCRTSGSATAPLRSTSRSMLSRPCPCPPLSTTAFAPERQQPLRLRRASRPRSAPRATPSSAAASGRLGVSTRTRGISSRLSTSMRVRRQQPVARGGHHHRIEHHLALPPALEPGRDRMDGGGLRQHADLHRAHRRSENTASIWAATKSAGTSWIAVTPRRVLGGERGDHAGAVDAQRRERLEIALQAGAAAGVGARDGDGDRRHAARLMPASGPPHAACRLASAASTMARRSRAAACGSGASDSAEITAMPSAPAAMTESALLASMPAMAPIGRSGSRAAHLGEDRAQAGKPDRRIRIVLGRGGEHAADADIVEMLDRGMRRLLEGLDAEPDDRMRTEQPPRILDRHVVLPQMHPVGAGRERHVGAIVDQERHAERRQPAADRPRGLHHGLGRADACRATAPAWRRRARAGTPARRDRGRRRARDRSVRRAADRRSSGAPLRRGSKRCARRVPSHSQCGANESLPHLASHRLPDPASGSKRRRAPLGPDRHCRTPH